MWKLSSGKRLIRDIAIPLAGVVMAFRLAALPHPDPSLIVLAASMMGFPFAALASRLGKKDDDGGDG